MNNKMYFLMEVAGLFLLGCFAFSDMAFLEKLLGLLFSFFLVGYPISMSEDEKKKEMYQKGVEDGRGQTMKIDDLIGLWFTVTNVYKNYLFVNITDAMWERDPARVVIFSKEKDLENIKIGKEYQINQQEIIEQPIF